MDVVVGGGQLRDEDGRWREEWVAVENLRSAELHWQSNLLLLLLSLSNPFSLFFAHRTLSRSSLSLYIRPRLALSFSLSLYIYMCVCIYSVYRGTCAVGTFGERNERERKRRTGNARLSSASRGVSRHPSGFLLSLRVVNQWQTTRLLVPSCL